jgi:hypothetical protein
VSQKKLIHLIFKWITKVSVFFDSPCTVYDLTTACINMRRIIILKYFLCWKSPWHLIKPPACYCSCERSIQCQSFIEIFRGLIGEFSKTRHHRTVTYSHIKIRLRRNDTIAWYPASERENKLILHNLTDCSHALERVFCKENTTYVNLS